MTAESQKPDERFKWYNRTPNTLWKDANIVEQVIGGGMPITKIQGSTVEQVLAALNRYYEKPEISLHLISMV